MLRVAFVLLLIRFTLATFQLRQLPRLSAGSLFRQRADVPLSLCLSLCLSRSHSARCSITNTAPCALIAPIAPIAHRQQPPMPRLCCSDCLFFSLSFSIYFYTFFFFFLFCRVIFNSFTFCTSALCVTNCFCVSVFTIVLIHFLLTPPPRLLPPACQLNSLCSFACLIKCTFSVVKSVPHSLFLSFSHSAPLSMSRHQLPIGLSSFASLSLSLLPSFPNHIL